MQNNRPKDPELIMREAGFLLPHAAEMTTLQNCTSLTGSHMWLFLLKLLKVSTIKNRSFSVTQAAFQVFWSHTWLVATIIA